MPDSDVDAEFMADHVWLVGGPDEVAEKLNELNEYVGGFGVLLVMGHEWQPEEQWRQSMELLVNEVLPKDQVLPRAWELAEMLVARPRLLVNYTRVAVAQIMKKQMLDLLGYGLALEGLAQMDDPA